MTSFAVKGETHEGHTLTLRKGFATREEAEDHPVTLAHWKRIWIEPHAPKPPSLPPFPWKWIYGATGQIYLVDASGNRIGRVWLGKRDKNKMVADFIVEACNTVHDVDEDLKASECLKTL